MIEITNQCGLGNRIKNLVSALRMGHMINDQVIMQTQHHFAYTFNQLSTEGKPNYFRYDTCHIEDLSGDNDVDALYKPRDIWVIDPSGHTKSPGVNLQYENIKPSAIKKWLTYFNLITWNPEIMLKVESAAKKYDIENRVGVHIRSWTDGPYIQNLNHNMNIFIDEMKKFPDKKFFLTCDDDNILKEFPKEFNKRIISNKFPGQKHIEFNTEEKNIINTIIDLFLLSKCKIIIGTYQSSFTEIAWWLGNCNSKVIIPCTEYVKQCNGVA